VEENFLPTSSLFDSQHGDVPGPQGEKTASDKKMVLQLIKGCSTAADISIGF